MKVEVSSIVNGWKVIYQGIVHLDGEESFDININGWSCTVRFLSDDGGSRYVGTTEEGRFYVNLYNHKNGLGESIFRAFPIANMDGKAIRMSYHTALINPENNIRRFEYCLWMEA